MSEKQPQVRLEPCDLPPPEEKPKTFALQRRGGEVVCCWLCEQRVATKPFTNGLCEDGGVTEVDLCQVCADLEHANAAFFPSQYPHLRLLRDLMRVTRATIRSELLRGRTA
jgi:hypothetical protein